MLETDSETIGNIGSHWLNAGWMQVVLDKRKESAPINTAVQMVKTVQTVQTIQTVSGAASSGGRDW